MSKSVFEQGEELLNLSINNPKFKLKYQLVLDRLINFRSDSFEEMNKATELIKEINAKFGEGDISGIVSALHTFRADITYKKANNLMMYRESVRNIVQARKVAQTFRVVANKSIANGMHKLDNKFVLSYAVSLAKEVQELHQKGVEEFWDKYELYKQFIVQAVNRGAMSTRPVPQLAEIIRIVEKEINTIENNNTEKLNVFSRADDIVDKVHLNEMLSEMIYISITDIGLLEPYMNEKIQLIEDELRSGKITDKESTSYIRELRNECERLLRPEQDSITPLITCAEVMQGKYKYEHLLQFTEKEMLDSFNLATQYVNYFTNDTIETLALNYRKFEVSEAKKISSYNKKELDKGSEQFLKMLLEEKVITPEKFITDLKILQEG